MRYHAAAQGHSAKFPKVVATVPVNPQYEAEVHVEILGLRLWFSRDEAIAFGRRLVEVGELVAKEQHEEAEQPKGLAERVKDALAEATGIPKERIHSGRHSLDMD